MSELTAAQAIDEVLIDYALTKAENVRLREALEEMIEYQIAVAGNMSKDGAHLCQIAKQALGSNEQ